MKKFWLTLLVLVGMFLVVGCDDPTENPDIGGNQTGWTSDKYEWKTPQTDKLKLDASYQGLSFINNGIGEVSVVRYVDGDTSIFKDSKTGDQFTVRYNGINTPESTYRIEPWGYAASTYNKTTIKKHLANGGKIVLETESMSERLDSTGKRYLAWVWLVSNDGDTRLLNLELAELGYAQVKSASGTKYANYFTTGIQDIAPKALRVYGEKDPDYDYSKEAKVMTIREIRNKYGTEEAIDNAHEGFSSPLIKVSGIVVRKNGNTNAYIQQYDQETDSYWGIYVYGGYNSINKLIEGALVEVTAKVGYYYGSLQITDLTSDNKITVYTFNAKDQIYTENVNNVSTIDDIYDYKKIGALVTLHNLEVTGYNDSDNTSATTLYCKYKENGVEKKFNIRINQEVWLVDPVTNQQILSGEFFVGKTFESITGVLTYYNGAVTEPGTDYKNGHIQLALTTMDDVIFAK